MGPVFSGALIFACYEFVRYCKLPLETLPFMILAVVANGYMADLYVFSMVFMAYGFAYLGIAISLRASRKYTNYFGIFIGTAAAVLTLLSYQVTGLALLFATSIAIINSTINNHQKNILYFAKPIISFCLGVAVFLALKALLGPSDGRNVSFSYLESNITSYISFSYVMLTQGMGRITPLMKYIFT